MNEIKVQAILENQTAVARKVLAYVPDREPLAASKIHAAASAECNHDLHITRGCLRALCDSGLIRQVSKDRYQRRVDIPGPRALKSLETPAASTPKLGDLMRPALTGTNFAQPIPPRQDEPLFKESVTRKPSAYEYLHVKEAGQSEKVVTAPTEKVVDPLAQMADLANELLDAAAEYGNRVKAITKRLEDVALAIESEREANGRAAAQLAKFKALLNDSEV